MPTSDAAAPLESMCRLPADLSLPPPSFSLLPALSEVRNLNLWGNDYSDIRVLRDCPNLEILSLSVNQIRTLADLAHCTQLRELYLRKNKIADLSEILHLIHLPHLSVLWLSENPCCSAPNYREFILSKLPHLTKLDNSSITDEEREMAASKQLKPSSNSGEFLSPRAAAALARFGSPRSSSNRQEGQSHSAFDFQQARQNKAVYDDIISPRRNAAAAHAGAGAGAGGVLSPRGGAKSSRIYAADDVALSSPTRAAFPEGQFSPRKNGHGQFSPRSSGAASARPRINLSAAGEDEARMLSPRQYTVLSPSGTVYSPSHRVHIPPLHFPSSSASSAAPSSSAIGGHKLARSPVGARPLAVSDFAASNAAQQGSKEGVSDFDAVTRRRTEALEEEIRLLKAAEETERRSERERSAAASVAASYRVLSPKRSARGGGGGARSSPSSPRSVAASSPRSSSTYMLSPRPRSTVTSPRSTNVSRPAGSAFVLSPNAAAQAAQYTGRSNSSSSSNQTTSNQSYGALTSRPASARPAAGEKPNPFPAFMQASSNQTTIASAKRLSQQQQQQRPQTASVGNDPKSPRAMPSSSAASHAPAAAPFSSPLSYPIGTMTPRSHTSHGGSGRPAHGSVTQHNLLTATLAMIEEFDLAHLQHLQKIIDDKLEEAQRLR